MKTTVFKIIVLAFVSLSAVSVFAQNPTYILNVTNDQQIAGNAYEFDIYLLQTGANPFEYANNSQYFININPGIINGGSLSFAILAGTCQLNVVQQILVSKVSFDAVNNRLRIAAHSPSGAGTGTIIANSSPGTRLGRFRVTNTVNFAVSQSNLSWYNFHSGFYTKVFAYVAGINVELTDSTVHQININNSPLPVIISAFNSTVSRNEVMLKWTTSQEINNSGFEIYRTEKEKNDWIKEGFVHGQGTTNESKNYEFKDKNLQTAIYKYKLKQMDFNGNSQFFMLNNDVEVGKPGSFSVSQNYPNPSNPVSKIDFQLPSAGRVTIKVYDLIGREVRTLVDENKEAGYYSAEFDGTNIASGIYIYRIIAGSFSQTKKLVLVK